MCAINGIIGHDTKMIDIMIEMTKHRGPDASGYYTRPGIALGHNRLSILDPEPRSNQPFISPDGRYVLVFNGEIYNYKELRNKLKGYQFVTNSDTEVLLALLIIEGESAISKLNGIFSFAFWDEQEKEVILARDPMGVKPLYYAKFGDSLLFSSELTALSAASSELRTISRAGISSYLNLGYTIFPASMIKGINKMPAGHILRYGKSGRGVTLDRYWHAAGSKTETMSYTSIRETIGGAVKRQLVSDRQLGLTLSGGLDSSIILHHAREHAPHIQTFSSAFEETEEIGEKFNYDAKLAARTAEFYNVPHKIFNIPAREIHDSLETILSQQAEPVANPTTITRSLLYKMIRKEGVVVVLGGDGGDELFGGYPRYQRFLAASYFQRLPQTVQTIISTLYPRARDLRLSLGTQLHLRLMSQQKNAIDKALKHDHWSSMEYITHAFDKLYEQHQDDNDPVSCFMRIDRESWLAEESLLQTDINSMRHGIEARVPMLDLEVVRLSDQIAASQKMSLINGSKLRLRNAYQRELPAYLFDQPKRGWQSPGAKWLRDKQIQTLLRNVFSSSYYSGLDNMVDWDSVQNMYTRHIDHTEYCLYPLWHILQLQIWARSHKIRVGDRTP